MRRPRRPKLYRCLAAVSAANPFPQLEKGWINISMRLLVDVGINELLIFLSSDVEHWFIDNHTQPIDARLIWAPTGAKQWRSLESTMLEESSVN